MRELSLITVRIVDETARIDEAEIDSFYTTDNDGLAVPAIKFMRRGADLVPDYEMALVRIEPCNPDSVLGVAMLEDVDRDIIKKSLRQLETAGLKLLDADNARRKELHSMSKTLSGDGVSAISEVQFYAVFELVRSGGVTSVCLQGVLDLDCPALGVVVNEAILL
jgi:hypothetical protein